MEPESDNSNFDQELWLECQKSQHPQSAYALVNLMSDISEKCMCAGWCMGTEFALWNFLHNQKTLESRTWGMGEITLSNINLLQELSQKSGGWWIWDDDKDREQFLYLDEAKKYFESWEKSSQPQTS